jgi:F1F0 ATPase subunit 2
MTDVLNAWILTIAGGAIVGGVYFAGLWWTVQRAARTSHPVLLIAGSFLVRGIAAAALLVGLAGGHPFRLLGAVGAFLVVRTLAVRLARLTAPAAPSPRLSPGKG